MRRLFVYAISVSSLVGWGRLLAQDVFILRNYPYLSSGVDAPVYDWSGNLLSGSEWRAELYGGAISNSLSPAVGYDTYVRMQAIFIRPGYFSNPTSIDVLVLGVPGGGWAWLQVKVWDVQIGATCEETVARGLGGYGQSPLFYAQGGDPNALPPTVPLPLTGLQSFSVLEPVPEPAGWVLVAFGLGFVLRNGRRR